jgi:DNA-binding NtrC family response regulator
MKAGKRRLVADRREQSASGEAPTAAANRPLDRFNLRSRLRFDVDNAQIWLDENRMLLMHAKSFGALRKELFETLGARRAEGVLLRMGFASGQHHADVASTLTGQGDPFEVYRIGPELYCFEGMVKSHFTEHEVDWEKGEFYCRAVLQNSWEAEDHLRHFGRGEECACWNVVGYASGFTTRFLKHAVIFREVQCVRQGYDHCVVIGRHAEAWGDDPYLQYFDSENIEGEFVAMEQELNHLRRRLGEHAPHNQIVGEAPTFKAAFHLLSQAVDSPISVLLLGETGTGKELFARWLHENGPRTAKPFVAVNCSAIPHDLIESELFGVRRGAVTGAHESRPGRFERADGGTLFLDEVGDLPLAAQVKLLRVLQTGEVERVGDDQVRKVDVRIVSATNLDLQRAIAENRFRADLYYRIATYPVKIPALRERQEDIPLLAAALIDKYGPLYAKKGLSLSPLALEALRSYAWPGNVRELENMIERGVLLARAGGEIEISQLFAEPPRSRDGETVGVRGRVGITSSAAKNLCETILCPGFALEAHEAELMELAVRRANGNLAQAARSLGITRRQLSYRLKQGGVDTERLEEDPHDVTDS